MKSKTIFYDAVTFKFIRRKERERILRKGKKPWNRLKLYIGKLIALTVEYSFVDLIDDPAKRG